ncbi:MAG: hypothetical protein IPM31_16790 [Anaerolineae bacterium]|nr:hypothetical protein [Anaerolineae bacterium]
MPDFARFTLKAFSAFALLIASCQATCIPVNSGSFGPSGSNGFHHFFFFCVTLAMSLFSSLQA